MDRIQKLCPTTHEYCDRVVRDLPILGRAVRLNVQLRRVGCRDCGKRMEVVSWMDRLRSYPIHES
uniref:transposase family protein n=1 Tax=Pseudomonas veronii TaxID=76761 RepID=UPI0036F345FF